jgi:branched-chain amino acid transport system substrate-binding protein
MEGNTKIIIGVFIAAIIIVGGILILNLKKESYATYVAEKTPIKIGVFAVLSGEAADYGKAIQNGLDIAVEDLNSKGGVLGRPVDLVYEDTHLDPKSAVAAMNKFVSIDGFPIVIAAEGSGATLAAAPLADSTKTLMLVAIASTPSLKDSGDYVFRVVPSDDYQGKEMAKLANSLGYKKAAILHVNDAYGIGIRDVFSNDFGNVAVNEAFDSGATDIKTQLTKIKSQNPNVIVVVARQEFPIILKQTKELGIKSQIMTSVEFKNEAIINASGESAEGVLIPFYAEATDYAGFGEKYKAKYGTEPATFSDYGYDALGVLASAIEKAGTTDSTKVKDALYNTTYYGATGIVQFDENGEVVGKPFVIYKVENGSAVEFGK